MNFKQYVLESVGYLKENELADIRKRLHDQRIKYAVAQKRNDKSAAKFWNDAIKNTEEELKYYENENFSSTDDD